MSDIKFIDHEILFKDIQVIFDDTFYDYYLHAPGMPQDTYIVSLSDIRVGFSSKYHLHKLLLKLSKDLFSEGIVPANNIAYKVKPTLSEPVIRRLGGKYTKVVDTGDTDKELAMKLERGQVNVNMDDNATGDIDTHDKLNLKPTGPMI